MVFNTLNDANDSSNLTNYWIANNYSDYTETSEAYSIPGSSNAVDNSAFASDFDSDGIADWYELFYNLNPYTDDSFLDPDLDLLTNIDEYHLLTNPNIFNEFGSLPDPVTTTVIESLIFLIRSASPTGSGWLSLI